MTRGPLIIVDEVAPLDGRIENTYSECKVTIDGREIANAKAAERRRVGEEPYPSLTVQAERAKAKRHAHERLRAKVARRARRAGR